MKLSIVSLNVFTVEYKPLKGSSYIPLPSCLASKKAIIINMQNEDDQCFMWSVTRALNSKEIPTLEELRQLVKERGLNDIQNSIKRNYLSNWKLKLF